MKTHGTRTQGKNTCDLCGHPLGACSEIQIGKVRIRELELDGERLRQATIRWQLRADKQLEHINENWPYVIADQKHMTPDSVEKAYWHYGYMVALRDVIEHLRTSERNR